MAINTTKEFVEGDRYQYDRLLWPQGYSSVDTQQDASWYGCWANPVTKVIFTFAEGDCITTSCDSDDEFIAEITALCDWHREHSEFFGIDPGLKEAAKQPWIDLGLSSLLH